MLVWYAAYGSNLCSTRLRAYLAGGAVAGARRRYFGARDPAPPRADHALLLDRALYFGSGSSTWGAGSAFVDHHPGPERRTYARAYLLTAAQFADLVAQECGLDVVDADGRPTADAFDLNVVTGRLETLRAAGQRRFCPGRYGTLLHLGDLDGRPVVTCTAPDPLADARLAAPSAAYLDLIMAGLAEAWGLSATDARAYLDASPGQLSLADPGDP